MSETVLLLTGIAVFGLMLIAVLLTIFEFNTINESRKQRQSTRVTADGREILRKEPD